MMRVFKPALLFANLAVMSAAPTAVFAEPLKVIATIAPIHSLVASVMQGTDTPQLLVKGASSEHTYSLKPSDARALSNADVIIRTSKDLESFLNKPIESLPRQAIVITLDEIAGMKLLPPREGGAFEEHDHDHGKEARGSGHHHGAGKHSHGDDAKGGKAAAAEENQEHDPHLWLDTGNAALIADHVAEKLGVLRPEQAAVFKANAVALKDKLGALDAALKGQLDGVKEGRFIVFHDAYQYFEARYGLKAAGSITVSPERQPGAARLKAIRAKIADAQSACVFSEPQFEPKLVARLVEGTKARTGVLDGLGAALPEGPDQYFTMMRGLASSLRNCLAATG